MNIFTVSNYFVGFIAPGAHDQSTDCLQVTSTP